MTEVRTRDEAIAIVDRALQLWETNVTGILGQAQNSARAAQLHVEDEVRKRATKVAAIEAQMRAAKEEQQQRLQNELVLARQAHEGARRAAVRINDVATGVSQLNRAHISASVAQVASARSQLSSMSRALESYRSGAVSLGSNGSGGGGGPRPASGGLAGFGLADVNVNSADLDDNPILDDDPSGGTFGKGGLTRADYRWAVQTWNDTVGPGIAGGKTRDDFAQRDARSSAPELRRSADVYDMFLGEDRICVERRPDGSLHVLSGRHRLLIARELGIKSLPGQVLS